MGIFDLTNNNLKSYFEDTEFYNEDKFYQYHHLGNCEEPCDDCIIKDKCIFNEIDDEIPPVGENGHPNCDCYYTEIEKLKAGSISKYGEFAPDVYLKNNGKLPNYYITKEEAENKFGWNPRRNTMAGKAPGYMIGGDIYKNRLGILPLRDGRIWFECDVDYIEGSRSTCSRLYYSNDGLMFYSDHFKDEVYQII